MISNFKSVVLASRQPQVVTEFYRDVLGLPLELERHRGVGPHWAGMVGQGDQHFAVHDAREFWLPTEQQKSFVSFDVKSIDDATQTLAACNVPVVATNRIGPMRFVALRDPDGSIVCLAEAWPQRAAK